MGLIKKVLGYRTSTLVLVVVVGSFYLERSVQHIGDIFLDKVNEGVSIFVNIRAFQ